MWERRLQRQLGGERVREREREALIRCRWHTQRNPTRTRFPVGLSEPLRIVFPDRGILPELVDPCVCPYPHLHNDAENPGVGGRR